MHIFFFIFHFFYFFIFFIYFFNLCCMVKKKKRLGHWSKPVTRLATVACMREPLTHACNSRRIINLPKERKLKNLPGKAEGDSCFNGWLLDVHGVEELLGVVRLRGEGEDVFDGDGGLPDCCCFLLCFCCSASSQVLPSCVVACAIIGRWRR
jgi:hypothetical protein